MPGEGVDAAALRCRLDKATTAVKNLLDVIAAAGLRNNLNALTHLEPAQADKAAAELERLDTGSTVAEAIRPRRTIGGRPRTPG